MIKKTMAFAAALLCATVVSAQSEPDELDIPEDMINVVGSFKNHILFVGPKVGGTFTTMSKSTNECDLADGMGIGFSGGLAAKVRFGRPHAEENDYLPGSGAFGLGLEAKYTKNATKTVGGNLGINYFEVPVYARIYPLCKTTKGMNSFFIEAGAAFAGTFGKKTESLLVDLPEGGRVEYKTGDIKGFDFRPLIGFGVSIPGEAGANAGKGHLEINARYYVGTSNLAGNMPCKMNHVEVSLAYMFSCGKF